MTKIIALFNKKRQHFKNRLKLRKGSIIWLLFAKRLPPTTGKILSKDMKPLGRGIKKLLNLINK